MIAFNLSHYLVDYIHHYRKYAVIQKNGSYFIPAILLSHSDVVPMTVLTLQLVAAGSHCSATGKNAGHSITSPSCPMEPSIGGYPGYPTTFLLISAASDIPQNLKSSSCIPIPNIYIPLNPILSHYIPIDHSSTESVTQAVSYPGMRRSGAKTCCVARFMYAWGHIPKTSTHPPSQYTNAKDPERCLLGCKMM